jgi:cyanate permease
MATGPLLAGYAYDMTGQYRLPIILLAVISLGHIAGYVTAFGFIGARRRSVSA